MRTYTRKVYLLEGPDGTKSYITAQQAGGQMATAKLESAATLHAHVHDAAGIYYYSSYPRQQTCYKLLSGDTLWVIERLYATGVETTSESRDIDPQLATPPGPQYSMSRAGDFCGNAAITMYWLGYEITAYCGLLAYQVRDGKRRDWLLKQHWSETPEDFHKRAQSEVYG